MPKWAIVVSALILVVGLTTGYLGLRPRVSDRDQILYMIADAEQAANAQQFMRLLKYIAADYRDSHGYTRADLKRMALQAERSMEPVEVGVEVTGLVVASSRGQASAQVLVNLRRPMEGSTDSFRIDLKLAKRGRRWLVVKAEGWQEATLGESGGEQP